MARIVIGWRGPPGAWPQVRREPATQLSSDPVATRSRANELKLYYSPGACSLSPHIVLQEAGLPFTAVLAGTKTHQLADGTGYYSINPKGHVPLLELDGGQRLTEAVQAAMKVEGKGC